MWRRQKTEQVTLKQLCEVVWSKLPFKEDVLTKIVSWQKGQL